MRLPRSVTVLTATTAMLLSFQTMAQQKPVVTLELPDSPELVEVDESQLRRYAAAGDYARVDAEVRRLQSLYPNWVPPNDLYGAPPVEDQANQVDTTYLWAVYQAGDMTAVDDEIAILKRLNPGWVPPADLTRQVNAARTKNILKEARETENWAGIVSFHQANPTQFVCEDIRIESIWFAAEAYAKLGQIDAAYDIYRSAIDSCRSADLRLSTLQKAMAYPSQTGLRELFALEEGKFRDPANQERFASIKRNWQGDPQSASRNSTDMRFGRALQAASANDITDAERSWLEQQTSNRRDHNAAMVLGWYHFNADDLPAAARWFESSMGWRGNAKAAEGLALTYNRMGRPQDAEQIAIAWADRVDGLNELLDASRLQQAWDAINDDRPGDGLALVRTMLEVNPDHPEVRLAQAWALLALRRSTEARTVFESLLDNRGVSDELENQAAHGVAIAAIDRGDLSTARRMMSDYEFGFDAVDDIERELSRQAAAQAFERGSYEETYVMLSNMRARWPEHYQLEEIEGWTLYHLGRYEESLEVFKTVYRATSSEGANQGITAAQLQIFGFD